MAGASESDPWKPSQTTAGPGEELDWLAESHRTGRGLVNTQHGTCRPGTGREDGAVGTEAGTTRRQRRGQSRSQAGCPWDDVGGFLSHNHGYSLRVQERHLKTDGTGRA